MRRVSEKRQRIGSGTSGAVYNRAFLGYQIRLVGSPNVRIDDILHRSKWTRPLSRAWTRKLAIAFLVRWSMSSAQCGHREAAWLLHRSVAAAKNSLAGQLSNLRYSSWFSTAPAEPEDGKGAHGEDGEGGGFRNLWPITTVVSRQSCGDASLILSLLTDRVPQPSRARRKRVRDCSAASAWPNKTYRIQNRDVDTGHAVCRVGP